MNRPELIMIIASALVLAALLGWCLRWIFGLLSGGAAGALSETELGRRLLESEAARAAAEDRLGRVEHELTSKLAQSQAEVEAAMAGLGQARRENGELQAQLDAAGTT